MWRGLVLESAVLLGAACLLGAVFGLYGQVVLSHALATITGFPLVFSVGALVAAGSFALVTLIAVAMIAIPGYLAVRLACRDARGRALISSRGAASFGPRLDSADPCATCALGSAAMRELLWGLRGVSCEIEGWRVRASEIPRAESRRLALEALRSKRGHIDGAALFWILAPRRDAGLLRLLVAYDVLCDYLDSLTEQEGAGDARLLHRAITDALKPGGPSHDYFAGATGEGDGGYLDALVGTCRRACAGLPAFAVVQPHALREAGRAAEVLPLNHLPAAERDAGLQAWAEREAAGAHGSRGTSWERR